MLKIYWDKTSDNCEECVVKKACDRGELDLSCACEGTYQIRRESEEPELKSMFETEYEWKKKRFAFLVASPCRSSQIMNEIGNLSMWLEENKPKPKEKWEQCTTQNTINGDEVRNICTGTRRTVKYILNRGETFIGSDKIEGNDLFDVLHLKFYKINTAKEK